LTGSINAYIAITRKAEVLEQETALEVFIGMQNSIELARVPQVFVFDLFGMSVLVARLQHLIVNTYLLDFILMCGLEDAVASNVVSLASDVFTHLAEKVAVGHTHVRE
jgi:hypothetical protein